MANPSLSTSDRPEDSAPFITFWQKAAPVAVGEEHSASDGGGGVLLELASNDSSSVDVLSEKLDLAVTAYVTPLIVALGLAANVLCCLALRAARFQPAVSALILGLVAAGDSLALVLNLLEYTVPRLMLHHVFYDFYFSSGMYNVYNAAVGSFIAPASRLLHRYETLLLLLLILDRYVAVFKPCGLTKLLRSIRQTLVFIGAAFVSVALFSLPDFLVYGQRAAAASPAAANNASQEAAAIAVHSSTLAGNATRPLSEEGRQQSTPPQRGYVVMGWSTSPLYVLYQILLILCMTLAPFFCLNFMVMRIAWSIRNTVLRKYSVRFAKETASVGGAQSPATVATTVPACPSPVGGAGGRQPPRPASHQSLVAVAGTPEPPQRSSQSQSQPQPLAQHNMQKRDEYRSVLVTLLAFAALSIVCDVPAIVVASVQAALSSLRLADLATGADATLNGGFAFRKRMAQVIYAAQATSEHLSLVDGFSNFLILLCLHKRYREAFVRVSGLRRVLDAVSRCRERYREAASLRRLEHERQREWELACAREVELFRCEHVNVASCPVGSPQSESLCGCGYRVSPAACSGAVSHACNCHLHQQPPGADPLLEQWPFTEFLARSRKTRATPAVWRRILFAQRAR